MMKLGVLFSGGKDSVYATYRAMQKEEVSCLISLISENDESYMFHTPNIHLASLQAEAMGLPILEYSTSGIEEEELKDLKEALSLAVEQYGIEGVVTGAILSVYQAARIQKVCDELNLWCCNPLWHIDQDRYMQTLLDEGFEVIISGVFSAPFDETWLGRQIDAEALRLLRLYAAKYHITLSGEGGELETLVTDAPFFKKKIVVMDAKSHYANYNGRYHIHAAEVVDK
jgi:ABC transporter with metal-binding/Fe-S-binding domain ATP-binding protein